MKPRYNVGDRVIHLDGPKKVKKLLQLRLMIIQTYLSKIMMNQIMFTTQMFVKQVKQDFTVIQQVLSQIKNIIEIKK